MNKKNVLLTGIAGNLGDNISEYLNSVGYEVIGLDLKKNPKYVTYLADLTNEKEVEAVVNSIVNEHGNIFGLINNAGVIYSEPLVNILNKESPIHKFSSFHETLSNNLVSAFNVSRYVASHMIKKRIKGSIVNISSISAFGNAGQTAYSAAKAGLIGMSNTWSMELGAFGIRSNAIAPGFIDTQSTHNSLSEGIITHIKKNTPLKKLGDPNSVSLAIEFCLKNEFLTGETIRVDGGIRIS